MNADLYLIPIATCETHGPAHPPLFQRILVIPPGTHSPEKLILSERGGSFGITRGETILSALREKPPHTVVLRKEELAVLVEFARQAGAVKEILAMLTRRVLAQQV